MSALNITSFIWGIADDVLRDIYGRGKYRDVILPMTVIRRLDAVMEPTKAKVLRMKKRHLPALRRRVRNGRDADGRRRYTDGVVQRAWVTGKLDVREAAAQVE